MSTNLGGINTYLYNLYKNSDKTKFQFDFINTTGKKFALQEELEEENVNIFNITPRNINYKKHINDLKNIFKNNDYDFIHINIMGFSWFEPILLANKYSKAKIIIHSHCSSKEYLNSGGFKGIILDKIGRFMIRNISYLRVACGKQAGKFMFSGKKFTIFYNGIDLEKFKFNDKYRNEIRKELNIKDDDIVIGQIAKFEPQKNPLFLIEIFKEYHKLNGNSKLIIAGSGTLFEKVKKLIESYKLDSDVLLLGRRDDAYRLYSAFDLFIMPSLAEGFSISLVEAQTNGLKCFTSTNVDEDSNINGNVEFLSLDDGPRKWAEYIYSIDNIGDIKRTSKIPREFDYKEGYKKVFNFYENNLK